MVLERVESINNCMQDPEVLPGQHLCARATEVDEFSFPSETVTLILAGNTWALPTQIQRRDPVKLSSALDDSR